jgi:polygalacturonase
MTITVTDHGVVPDGKTLNTPAIQAWIDRCAANGGGTLRFPAGRYLTGGLTLCSHLTLQFDNGAVLLGSPNLDHYRHYDPVPEAFQESAEGLRALLFAIDCEQIRLLGPGTIDGQGALLSPYTTVRAGRPRNIWFARCKDVTVDGLHLRSSGFWMQHYLKCQGLRLIDLDVWNHESCNNDGIDVDCCRDVIIRGCKLDTADDAICLKSGNDQPTENVLVTSCITRTHCNHFKIGTESNGGFRNIRVDGMVMIPSDRKESHPGTEGADYRGASGIAIGSVDGGMLENISVQNVTMDQVRVPFFIRLGDRGRPIGGTDVHQPVSYSCNISISGVRAKGASSQGCYVIGLPDARIRDVSISDCDLEFEGGVSSDVLNREIPQNRAGYPSMEAFGTLPAYGIFARDVDGLELRNMRLNTRSTDPRPAFTWHNCTAVSADNIKCGK